MSLNRCPFCKKWYRSNSFSKSTSWTLDWDNPNFQTTLCELPTALVLHLHIYGISTDWCSNTGRQPAFTHAVKLQYMSHRDTVAISNIYHHVNDNQDNIKHIRMHQNELNYYWHQVSTTVPVFNIYVLHYHIIINEPCCAFSTPNNVVNLYNNTTEKQGAPFLSVVHLKCKHLRT